MVPVDVLVNGGSFRWDGAIGHGHRGSQQGCRSGEGWAPGPCCFGIVGFWIGPCKALVRSIRFADHYPACPAGTVGFPCVPA
eukprot:14963236-Heterocapsa_arctica.AAC.1